MPDPDVTAVIATAGRRASLAGAVASARNQQGVVVEVIVVWDGPSETIPDWLYSQALVLQTGAPNRGPAFARNLGVQAARAPAVAFLDDDDLWLPAKSVRQLEILRDQSEVGLVLCRSLILDANGSGHIWPYSVPPDPFCVRTYLYGSEKWRHGSTYIAMPSVMTRTSVARAVPFREHMANFEDLTWLMDVQQSQPHALARYDKAVGAVICRDGAGQSSEVSRELVLEFVRRRDFSAGERAVAVTREALSRGIAAPHESVSLKSILLSRHAPALTRAKALRHRLRLQQGVLRDGP